MPLKKSQVIYLSDFRSTRRSPKKASPRKLNPRLAPKQLPLRRGRRFRHREEGINHGSREEEGMYRIYIIILQTKISMA